MAYNIDPQDENALVFNGQEDGIADNPYAGVSDMRNLNNVTIPGEVSVNFATAKISPLTIANGSVSSADAGTYYLTYTGAANLENNMAINFTAQSGLGVTANLYTTYWVFNVGGAGAGTFQISANYNLGSPTPVHVMNGTGTFTVYKVGQLAAGAVGLPVDFAYDKLDGVYFMLDAIGQVWSNYFVTGTHSYWTFVGSPGKSTPDNSGAGLVYYQASDNSRYLFVFRDDSIDYLTIIAPSVSYPVWTWGWNPSLGTSNNASGYLNANTTMHKAVLGPDNVVYYCDGSYISQFYQNNSQGYTQITYSGLSGTLSVGDIVSDGGGASQYTNISYSTLSGTLNVGDTVSDASGVVGTIQSFNKSYILAKITTGTFSTSGTLTDTTTGATATITGTYVVGNSGTIISYTGSTILIDTPTGGFSGSGTLTDITSGATATISSVTTFAFNPSNTSTYTFNQVQLLPFNDAAQCIAFLGSTMLIGSSSNVIYPWDLTFQVFGTAPNFTFVGLPAFWIFLPESNCIRLVTVGGNCYIFTGNQGRIYITNGSQAQFYKKVPDHLSGTISPYYTWGGACSSKNQLYFSVSVTNNAGTANNNYGGVWAIDLDSKYGGQYAVTSAGPIRLSNQLSYGTYAGYATALIPNFTQDPAGTGFFAGWYDGVSIYGIDQTVTTPYTSSQAYIDFDMVPIGTIYKPVTPKTIEYKLSVPMVANESVTLYYRTKFSDAYTQIFASSGVGVFSDINPVNFNNAQWVQLRAVLNSTATNPSYCRLTEIRLKQDKE